MQFMDFVLDLNHHNNEFAFNRFCFLFFPFVPFTLFATTVVFDINLQKTNADTSIHSQLVTYRVI